MDIGKVAILGGGSWATALAHLLLKTQREIVWYQRRQDRIDEFLATGHNPVYLSDVQFDTDRIRFTADINVAIAEADTLVMAMPSPYFKSHMDLVTPEGAKILAGRTVASAIKGIVPDDNLIVSDYLVRHFGVDPQRVLAIGGPCHAEEVAMERRSYLTVGCRDIGLARALARSLENPRLTTVTSTDIDGIEYAAVLKNVYAIAAGMVHGMKAGDNFLAVLVSNAVREMNRFLSIACPAPHRDICQSVYLGDLLVTSYSRFSRNHNFGSMIGMGYSVKAARMEMEQTAEGYFGTRCMHVINESMRVYMPILEGVHAILYEGSSVGPEMRRIAATFN